MEILYSLEKTESSSASGKIPDERKLLYKQANFEIPKYKHSYVKYYSYNPGTKTINLTNDFDKFG